MYYFEVSLGMWDVTEVLGNLIILVMEFVKFLEIRDVELFNGDQAPEVIPYGLNSWLSVRVEEPSW